MLWMKWEPTIPSFRAIFVGLGGMFADVGASTSSFQNPGGDFMAGKRICYRAWSESGNQDE
jgi:hypothetical protein